MKPRYRLIIRRGRGATFYCVDRLTNKRTSLQTADRYEADRSMPKSHSARWAPSPEESSSAEVWVPLERGGATATDCVGQDP